MLGSKKHKALNYILISSLSPSICLLQRHSNIPAPHLDSHQGGIWGDHIHVTLPFLMITKRLSFLLNDNKEVEFVQDKKKSTQTHHSTENIKQISSMQIQLQSYIRFNWHTVGQNFHRLNLIPTVQKKIAYYFLPQ